MLPNISCLASCGKSVTVSALAFGLTAAALFNSAHAEEDTITLKAVTPYTAEMYLSHPLFIFEEMVEERTGGRVDVQVLGGNEVVPSLEQFEAVRNGVVDVALGVASYYNGTVPEGMALLYNRDLKPSELRETGFFDLLREIHLEKGGVVFLANAGGTPGQGFRLYTNTEVDSADLSGLRLRVSSVYTTLVEELGGVTVSMPPSDAYTGLERGIVQGLGWTYASLMDYGFHEVTDYVIDHPFYSLNQGIILNKERWDALPADVRQILEELAPDYEKAVQDYMAEFIQAEDEKLKAAGMEFIELSPEEAEKFYHAAYEKGWERFLETAPEHGPKLRELAER